MKVSVCIATYNGAKYIKEQIDSILKQNFVKNPNLELEIIISDDMSKDETISILENYRDGRIKIFYHTERSLHKHYTSLFAATANFANAINKANGDYIFLADQDDIWYPNKIDDSLKILKEKEGVVAADFDVISENGTNIGRVEYQDEPFWRFKRKCMPYGFSIGFARSELKYIMPMPNVHQHDSFICLLAQRRGKLNFLHTSTAAHRWFGDDNTSSSAMREPLYYKIWVRIKMWAVVLWRTSSFYNINA